ncbi:MAG: glycosyltransferase family 39 protein [Anaerolineae bacterium]|nr:glycosyltransferase family 39 protein [Anaerolineae bacterium]
MRSERLFPIWLLILLIAWGLWLHRLDARDLSFDEAATWYIARQPPQEMFRYLREAIYEHPPVYYTLMHIWISATGNSEFALRLFSVIAALIALPLLGWAVRQPPAGLVRGLISALLLAVMPGFVYYARNARMYTLNVVWVILSAGVFLRGWLNTRSWPHWRDVLLLGTVHLLAVFTHYYLILPILAQSVVLLFLRRWRPLAIWLALHVLLAFPALVWLLTSPGLQDSVRGFRLFPQVPAVHSVAQLLRLLIFSQEVRPPFSILYIILAIAGLGVLLTLLRKPSRTVGLWLACTLLFPLALAYQLPKAPTERYILFLLPYFAWALSFLPAVIFHLPRSWQWLAGIVSLALASGLSTNGLSHVLNPQEGGYGHTLKQVQRCAQPGDGILFYGPWQWLLFQYYDPGDLPPITTLPPQAPPTLSPDEARPVLENLLRQYDRLWVLPAAVGDVDPEHFVEGWLNTHTHPVWRNPDFALYLPPLSSDVPGRSVGAIFDGVLKLERVEWESATLSAGQPLRFTLYWTVLRPLTRDVRLSLELRDREGHSWSSACVVPGEWAYPPSAWQPGETILDRQGLMVPPGAPPGEYVVHLIVADAQTGEPLTAANEGEIALFSVMVEEPAAGEAFRARACAFPESEPTTFCSPGGTQCLSLVAGESPHKVYQGYPVPVDLHWTISSPLPDLSIRLEVIPWLNTLRSSSLISVTAPVLPDYPPSQWLPGRLVTQKIQVPLPPDAPSGPAQLRLTVIGPDGTPWRTSKGLESTPILRLKIQRRPALRYLPPGVRRIRVAFGDAVELRGYRVEGEARPGGTLYLTYIWYARKRPPAIYAVFNHLMTENGLLVAQKDGWPQEGRWLTTQWLPGDYVEDHYILTIPGDAPPGPYRFSMGMYDATTGERLPAVKEGERLPEDRLFLPLPGHPGFP